MKRVLLTLILIAAVSVTSGSCCGSACAANRPNTKAVKTVKQKKAKKYETCTAFKCNPPKHKYAKR